MTGTVTWTSVSHLFSAPQASEAVITYTWLSLQPTCLGNTKRSMTFLLSPLERERQAQNNGEKQKTKTPVSLLSCLSEPEKTVD